MLLELRKLEGIRNRLHMSFFRALDWHVHFHFRFEWFGELEEAEAVLLDLAESETRQNIVDRMNSVENYTSLERNCDCSGLHTGRDYCLVHNYSEVLGHKLRICH